MIPEHNHDGGLVKDPEILHQGAEGRVGLARQGEVLLRHGVLPRRVGYGDLRRVVRHGIAAVVLDGDVEQEQRLPFLLVLKLPDNLFKVGLVADVAVLEGLGHIHVVAALVGVEAQPGVGPVSLPRGPLPGVEGQGGIALRLQNGGQGGGGPQHILLVGDAARGQEGHGVAGEELELAGAGARAEHRGVGVAIHRVVQGADVVGDAGAEGHVSVVLKVGPGLVHDGHNIGPLHGNRRRLRRLHAGHDLFQPLRPGVLRLLHLEELRVAEEYRQAAASTVGAGGVPHIGLNTETLQPPGGEQEQEAGQPCPQAHQPQGPPRSGEAQAGLVFLRMEEHNQGRRQGDGRQHLPRGRKAVAPRHIGGGAQGGEIPGQDGGAPEGLDKAVGRAPRTGGDVDADAAGGDAPGQTTQGPVQQGDAQGVGQQRRKEHGPGQDAVGELHEPGGGERGQQQEARLPQGVGWNRNASFHGVFS